MTQHQMVCRQPTPFNSPFARITTIPFLLARGSAVPACVCMCLLSCSPQTGWLSARSLSLVPLLTWPLLTGEHEQQEQGQVPQAAEEQFP